MYSGTAVWRTSVSTVGHVCVCLCVGHLWSWDVVERETIDVATVGSEGKSADAAPLALGKLSSVTEVSALL